MIRLMPLLDGTDMNRLLSASKGRQYSSVYAENVSRVVIDIQEKRESVKFSETAGAVMAGKSEDSPWRVYSQEIICKSNGALLSDQEIQSLLHIGRTALSTFPKIHMLGIRFVIEKKIFEVLNADLPIAKGIEEQSAVTYRWQTDNEEFFKERRQSSIKEVQKNSPITEDIASSLKRSPSWPVPGGEVPVYWESFALAKILLPFVRAFEGDDFLAKQSLLQKEELMLPSTFSIEDAPLTEFDCEGTPTRPLLIFHNGKPRGLALDRNASSLLDIAPTGHCRRESYTSQPTVGFWNLLVTGTHVDENLSLPWGLRVRDLEVTAWDLKTGQIEIKISDARLVHQGVIGESVNPFLISTNLIALLNTLSVFSPAPESNGFLIPKNGQKIFTKIRVPPAVSNQFLLVGEVPKQHYW